MTPENKRDPWLQRQRVLRRRCHSAVLKYAAKTVGAKQRTRVLFDVSGALRLARTVHRTPERQVLKQLLASFAKNN